jgi:RNA polymerase-binding transcription factor DksA
VERFEKQKKQIKEALEAISDAYYSACQEAGEAVDPVESSTSLRTSLRMRV